MAVGFVQRSFSGGEISVPLSVRVDQPKARYGCKTCRNMMVSRTGALSNRNGLRFIVPTKGNGVARLVTFAFGDTDSYAIEAGDHYMRFVRGAAQLQVLGPPAYNATIYYKPGDIVRTGAPSSYRHWYCTLAVAGLTPVAGPYWYELTMLFNDDSVVVGGNSIMEVPSPYAAADIFDVRFVQSGDVITLTHPSYSPPRELIRYGATTWTLLPMPSAPPIRSPAGLNAKRSGTAGKSKYRYMVTAIKKDTYEESLVGYAGEQLTGTIDNTGSSGDLQITFDPPPATILPAGGATALLMILDAYPTNGPADAAFEQRIENVVFRINLSTANTADLRIINAAGNPVSSAGIVAPPGYAVDVLIFRDTAGTPALSGFEYMLGSIPISGGGGGSIDLVVQQGTHGMKTGDVIFIAALTDVFKHKSGDAALGGELPGKTFSITVIDPNSYSLDGTAGLPSPTVAQQIHAFPAWVEITNCIPAAKEVAGDEIDQKQHVITVGKVNEACEYWVYREKNGIFGYLGTMAPTGAYGQYRLQDEGQEPDLSKTPPRYRNPFLKADSAPTAVGYVQQRLCFGGSNGKPQGVLMSRTGDFHNFSTRIPLEDDDALEFTVAGQRAYRIRHLIDIRQLGILTSGNELLARGDQDGVIRPTAINIDTVGYVGADNVPPMQVAGGAIYIQARGSQVIELRASERGVEPNDLTTWSPHLVDGFQFIDAAWAQSPYSSAFMPRSDGKLIQLTYIPQQEVAAFSRHDTRNEDVAGLEALAKITAAAVVPEGDEDVVYVVSERLVNGATVRYIERLAERRVGLLDSSNDPHATFLDSYVAYTAPANGTGAPAVAHLVGRTVNGLRDGVKIGPLVVSGAGQVAVAPNWSSLVLGIPINADVELYAVDSDSAKDSVVDRLQNVPAVTMLVQQSRGMKAGPSFKTSDLMTYQLPVGNNGPTALQTGAADMVIAGGWRVGGSLCIRQAEPLPFTLIGVVPVVEVGGRQHGASR